MKEMWKNLKFAWKYARSQKKKIVSFIFCNILYIIISVVIPILSSYIIVNLTNNKLQQVVFMTFILFFARIIECFIDFLCFYFSQVVYRETFTELQLDLGKNILNLTNSCIDEHSSGVFIQRLTNDTSKIADVFNLLNFQMTDLLTDIGIFAAILIIDIRIFICLILFILIIAYFEKKRVLIHSKKDKEFRGEQEKVSGFIGELVRGVRDIKMLSAEASFLKEFRGRLINLNFKRYDMSRVQRTYRFGINVLRNLLELVMIILLVYLISINELTIAIALVVYNYVGRVTYIVNSYSYLLEGIKNFNLSCSRIFDIIYSEQFSKERFGKKHLATVKGNFEFRNVSFGYKEDNCFLKDLCFKVKARSTIAFVGKSGAGKTTIFNLLCKMYDPISGKIFIDGEDISTLDRESIRNNITIISQNPYIFNLSIRDNFRLVKDDVTDLEIEEACRAACLSEFIESLPKKYDTIVGEGGINLSGGQRQRLAIARALVQKTEIILFDEATSALDNETQMEIQQAINNMKKDYTILIIAHRLSTIINCDRILYLENGKIAAEGTHEELLDRCLEYNKLYNAEIEK